MQKKILLFLVAVVFLFAFNAQMPVTDPVESNYALTAKEMVQSGDWLSPQIYGRYWFDKPIFFYWLTAISYKVLGFTDFASRVAPALCALASLGFITWLGGKLYNRDVGLHSAIILISCSAFFLVSKAIITDATLFLFFNICVGCFYLGYSYNKNYYYGCYAFAALSVLTKGPIGFLLPGLIFCIFVFLKRDWKIFVKIKIFSGTLLFLAIAAPWYFFMYKTHGSAFTDVFLGAHNFLRATTSEHPKDNVFYYYLVVLIIGFFPWATYLPTMIWSDLRKGWRNISDADLFLYIWAFTVIGFFQMMATKYATYTYPALLPLSILLARYLTDKNLKVLNNLYSGLFNTLFAVALFFAYRGVSKTPGIEMASPLFLIIGIVVFVVATMGTSRLSVTNKANRGYNLVYIRGLSSMFLLITLAYSVAVPLTNARSGKILVPIIEQYPQATLTVVNEYSASAVFYTGRMIYRLQEQPNLDDRLSWNVKNVMPYLSPKQANAGTLILARDKEYLRLPVANAQKIGQHKRWTAFMLTE